jgi:hypothetical protein
MFLFNSLVPVACLGVIMSSSFNSAGGTRLIALMIFIVGITWIIYGATLAQKLNRGYVNFTLSGQFMKRYAKNPGSKSTLVKGVVAASIADPLIANLILQFAPYPLNYFYYMGMFPYIPFAIFGVLPAIFTFFAIGPLLSLASVMDAGGDGTEYVEAKKIHWFYSLSPDDRDRVREGSDLEGDSDDRDDSSDEERGLTRGIKRATAVS